LTEKRGRPPGDSGIRGDPAAPTTKSGSASKQTHSLMTGPTRDEFLNYVHRELAHPATHANAETEPKKGSPTKSTQRCQWPELLPWDVEAEALAYWQTLSEDEKTAVLPLAGYWGFTQTQLDALLGHLPPNAGSKSHSVPPSKFPSRTRFEALATSTRKCALKALSLTSSHLRTQTSYWCMMGSFVASLNSRHGGR
jgi:hypothetical protein